MEQQELKNTTTQETIFGITMFKTYDSKGQLVFQESTYHMDGKTYYDYDERGNMVYARTVWDNKVGPPTISEVRNVYSRTDNVLESYRNGILQLKKAYDHQDRARYIWMPEAYQFKHYSPGGEVIFECSGLAGEDVLSWRRIVVKDENLSCHIPGNFIQDVYGRLGRDTVNIRDGRTARKEGIPITKDDNFIPDGLDLQEIKQKMYSVDYLFPPVNKKINKTVAL